MLLVLRLRLLAMPLGIASLSLRLAEAFLGLGLAQSRRTWPMPQVAKPDLIAALVAAGAGA